MPQMSIPKANTVYSAYQPEYGPVMVPPAAGRNPEARSFVPGRAGPVGYRRREQDLNLGKLNGFMNKSLDSEKWAATDCDDKKLAAEILGMLQSQKKRRSIPEGYVCHICYNYDAGPPHFINDCPRKHLGEARTPYQGPNQCYGEFQCERCKRKWKSCKSWANMSERCNKCTSLPNFSNECFPHRQFPLEHAEREGLISKDHYGNWRVVPQPKDREYKGAMIRQFTPPGSGNPRPLAGASPVRQNRIPTKRPGVTQLPPGPSPFDDMGFWESPPRFTSYQGSKSATSQQVSAASFSVGRWNEGY